MTDKINDIYSFYDAILTAGGYETKVDGEIWIGGKEPKQVALSGGKLVMPLKRKLKDPQEDEMFFHPLCEQMTRYESEVFKFIKRSMIINLTSSILKLGLGLIKLQEDPALQRKLGINQIEVIKGIASVDKNSMMAWSKMMSYSYKHHADRMDKWPVHIFLKRNGTFGKESFRRVAAVSFPFAEFIIDGGRLYDDKNNDMFRNKDYPCFKEVFTAIFPNATDPGETYNSGWNDPVAPYLSAFLLSYVKISDRINELCDMFAEVFEECGVSVDSIRLKNDEWSWLFTEKDSDALAVMSRVIPQLKGNTGATSEDEAKEEARETSAETRPRPAEKRVPTVEAAPVKVEAKKEEPPANETPQQAAERKQLEEARAKRAAWLAEQEEERLEDEKRKARRQEREEERRREEEEYERSRREREERRSERSGETPPWEDEPVKKDGKISASAIFGGSGRDRDRRDDRDYRDRRDDRDYRDRDRRRDRDYDDRRDSRDFFDRQERRDRDYDRRDDRRDGPWGGRRDSRDDRDYRDRDYRDRRDSRRGGPWGRR